MRSLYHYPLCPFGRLMRVYLRERGIEHDAIVERPWDRKKTFSEHPLEGDLPIFVDKDGIVLEGWYAIIEHLEQTQKGGRSFLGSTFREKAETRRLTQFFNGLFYVDVTKPIIFEKIVKRHMQDAAPDSSGIRRGVATLKIYMEHISWFADHRNWLAGDELTIADMAAAAQISCVDYASSVDWEAFPIAKEWYVRIKSRPSFRNILEDRVPEMQPSQNYANLDF